MINIVDSATIIFAGENFFKHNLWLTPLDLA